MPTSPAPAYRWMLMCVLVVVLQIAVEPTSAAEGVGGTGEPAAKVTAPPKDIVEFFDLNPFYTKHVSVAGFPIVSSDRVADVALLEAAYVVRKMLAGNDAVREAMIANKTRLAIMALDEFTTDIPEHSDLEPAAYWDRRARGLGATHWRPAVSAGEENLLRYPGDPYITESILVHEFAHAIHQMGLETVDETFDARLKAIYEQAMSEGLWEGLYAAENHHEYWAEGVQSWFDTNRKNDALHNHVDTRELLKAYDPRLAKLISEVFKGTPWRYTLPADRLEEAHLKGYESDAAPRFRWPRAVTEAFNKHNAEREAAERRSREK
ncbi:MAG: hypothetical protein WD294_06340 [Phycisphaeraceae bacterium]